MLSDTSGENSEDEYDSFEPERLELDLKELKRRASLALSRTCSRVLKLTRGRFHEIFVLYFSAHDETPNEQEWSCIARISRRPESLEKLLSEVQTMRYVRSRTSIPVPDVYLCDFDVRNKVGAQFLLIERLPGRGLHTMWDTLNTEDKKAVLNDLAGVLTQLSKLKFDAIGSLNCENEVGPLVYHFPDADSEEKMGTVGPFSSTVDYLLSFLALQFEASGIRSKIESIVKSYLSVHSNQSIVSPFRLIHADFDSQNLLFIHDTTVPSGPPRLSGVIDWEYSHTGPLYFLYDYPIFIQDNDYDKSAFAENALLRNHFVRALLHSFPKGSTDRAGVRACMRKNYTLNGFYNIFMVMASGRGMFLKGGAEEYIENIEGGSGHPYEGRVDYVSDEEALSDD
jgi:hypothetical protein